MPQEVLGTKAKNGGSVGGKAKRMMFGGSKFSQNSLSFDMRDSSAYHQQRHKEAAALKKSHSAEHDSACEEEDEEGLEDEDGVVLRKKKPIEFDSDDYDGVSMHSGSDKAAQSGILSTLISTSQRNSQLRSTLSKARHHLSFEKWRSSSSHNHQGDQKFPANSTSPTSAMNQSATPNSNPLDSTSANHSSSSANHSNLSNSSANTTPPTPNESPGGRLSRWFSIRRGSSHHYDLNSSGGSGGRGITGAGSGDGGSTGRDVRDGVGGGGSTSGSRLNSINNEHELAQQIQQQLHQSLSKVISQSNALQQLQQQSAVVTCCAKQSTGSDNGSKMPLVVEGNEREESYNTFGRGMSYRTTSTLKSAASINPSQLLTPMPPVPPAGLSQQQLKRRHIVAAIAHSEISYVATLSRLVNVSKCGNGKGIASEVRGELRRLCLYFDMGLILY